MGNNVQPMQAASNQRQTAQGTQTNPVFAGNDTPSMPGLQQPGGAQPAQGKKPRRKRGEVYRLAAKQRRLQQEYQNLQHPPSQDETWICEFCEYESIFGEEPKALVRSYEIKDRKERRRIAEKRRLLEKAKLKGRKGKKQTKASKVANSTAQQQANNQGYDQQPLDNMGPDDYLDDGYDDDPVSLPTPPVQVAMPRQPMTGTYTATGAAGSGGTNTREGPR